MAVGELELLLEPHTVLGCSELMAVGGTTTPRIPIGTVNLTGCSVCRDDYNSQHYNHDCIQSWLLWVSMAVGRTMLSIPNRQN